MVEHTGETSRFHRVSPGGTKVKTIAYLRISTASQNTDTQRLAILDYAYQHHMTIDEFVVTQASSRRSPANRGIDSLIARLQPADTLLVSELSRLGRSLSQIVQIIDQLIEQQVRFIAIKENIELEGSQDLKTKMMVAMFGLFAEIERDLISERTKEGLAAARAKGKIIVAVRLHAVKCNAFRDADQRECWGSRWSTQAKPRLRRVTPLDGKEQEIRMLLAKGVSKSAIAQIMSVSRATIRHFIKTRQLA
jgi:DNA invertase Pin-like site-specific DNA recombinase